VRYNRGERRSDGGIPLTANVRWHRFGRCAATMSWVAAAAALCLCFIANPAARASDWHEILQKAQKGDAAAQMKVADMYRNGRGVPKDSAEAAKWYRKAAEQGVPKAQTDLGLLYANGEGVPRDYGEAVEWYRKAAEQGDPAAEHGLGIMYHNGFGVDRDDAKANRFFHEAAQGGYYRKTP